MRNDSAEIFSVPAKKLDKGIVSPLIKWRALLLFRVLRSGLFFSININQLIKVAGNSRKDLGFIDGANACDDYAYDLNGTWYPMPIKNITSIVYNHLNLPIKVVFANAGNIAYR